MELGHGCQHLMDHIHKLVLKRKMSAMSRCRSCQVSMGTISTYSRGGFDLIPDFSLPLFQGKVELREAKLLHLKKTRAISNSW